MDMVSQTITARRADQAFPTLTAEEIERLRRFGTVRRATDGEELARSGRHGLPFSIVLSGEVEISQADQFGHRGTIAVHGPGAFTGELAQLSGRPSLVDAHARGDVELLALDPERLRAVLVAEAGLGERIMRALILRRMGLLESHAGAPVIIGRSDDADVLRLEGFLARNGHPHLRLDPAADEDARALVERFHVSLEELPIVLCPNGDLLRRPSEWQLGRCVGLVRPIDPDRTYDVTVIGAGPAGLATAVYAGSEGLSVLVVDCRAFGGQAGASARIENYLGFPTGISGMALMARAYNQAQKFGVEMAMPAEATGFADSGGDTLVLELASGERVRTHAAVVATGARYRRIDVAELDSYEGKSVHYWASPLEANLCKGRDVALVGGGNSAGQATVYLSDNSRHVTLIARRPLEETMSAYLIDRIRSLPNVEVVIGAEVDALEGTDGMLEGIGLKDRTTGERSRREACQLFLFVGAEPNTDWLRQLGLDVDARGFVQTGSDCTRNRLPLETSRPGVFAIGDVRAGSVKRIAAAVGDGAQVVATLNQYLVRKREAARPPGVPVPA